MNRRDLPRPAADYQLRRRRANQAAGAVIALVALIAFFAIVWPPAILLVITAAGLAYTWDWNQ